MFDKSFALNLIKKASFIAYPQKEEKDRLICPIFRKEFSLSSSLKKAFLITSGLGVYEVFVNGKRPRVFINGKMVETELKPGYTQVLDKKICSLFDITDMLNKGDNCLAVKSSRGYWCDLIADNIGRYPAFICSLFIEYENGETAIINSDESFKVSDKSPIISASIYDGEYYDNTISNDYMEVGYDDSKWQKAYLSSQYFGSLEFEDSATVFAREDLVRKAKTIYTYNGIKEQTEEQFGVLDNVCAYDNANFTLKKGQTAVIDFAQNGSGRERIIVSGKKGTIITIRHAEMLNDNKGLKSRGNDGAEGGLYVANLRTAKATTNYVIGSDNEREEYKPLFTYYGFRYIDITATDDVTFYLIEAETLTSVTFDSGFIKTGNPLVNRLIENARWGMYSNYLSIPTDCPQRDERYGWSCDTQVFAKTAGYLSTSAFAFLEKWMRDVKISQDPGGAFPAIAPRARFGNTMGDVGWADAGIIVPYTIYKLSGSLDIIKENYFAMKKYMDFFLKRRSNKGPFIRYGDWLSFEDNSDEVQEYLSVCFYAYDALLMSEMAKAIGIEEDKNYYQSIYEKQREYFIKTYLNEDGSIKLDTQTVLLYALKLNLVPPFAIERVKKQLIDNFKRNNFTLQTGFLGTAIILPTLTEIGLENLAYELLLSEKMPSWLYSVKQGATTIWERWNSYSIENGFGDVGMNSFNHYAYGCAVEWLFAYAGGIRAKDAGFNSFIIAPIIDKRLGFINAEYNSINGKIISSWEYKGDKVIFNISIPKGSKATFINPITKEEKLLESGEYQFIN